jgi:predicted TIM-barrel fold metal-dependent hydrolase
MNRIRLAVDYVEDPGKFMYGSDWPLTPMRPYLALIKRAIDSSHHERVFYANAKEVFKL